MRHKIPLRKGGKGGCKLVLMKMGNNPGKTQPPKSPFIKGDLKGLTFLFFWSANLISLIKKLIMKYLLEMIRIPRFILLISPSLAQSVITQLLPLYPPPEGDKGGGGANRSAELTTKSEPADGIGEITCLKRQPHLCNFS